jgi:hypothetical protein
MGPLYRLIRIADIGNTKGGAYSASIFFSTLGFQSYRDQDRKRRAAMKRVIIAVAGTEGKQEYKDVQLLPGTKPRDVLQKLNLQGFQLSRPDGGAYGFNDDLYAGVVDGQKVYATKADVEAGCG